MRRFVSLPKAELFPIPDALSNEEAAALPTAYLTAHYALNRLGRRDVVTRTDLRHLVHEARIEVENIPGRSGAYRAVAYLRPWLQMEELHASVRMVSNLPEKK